MASLKSITDVIKINKIDKKTISRIHDKVDEIKKALVMNYVDLAPSISASNSILDKIEGTPSKAYWTGQMWAPEIQFLNPPSKDSGFKNYNSSDVIFKVGKNFWGFSLKKKETPSSVNPTLLNKPASGKDSLLNGILDDKDLKIINDARINFFKKNNFKGLLYFASNEELSPFLPRQPGIISKPLRHLHL